MITKTRAIALHYTRYSETSVIAHIYTEQFGRLSLMVKGALRPRSKFKAILFEPFTLLELEITPPNPIKHSLIIPKEVRLAPVLHTLRQDVRKTTIALFLSELLYRSVRDEQADSALFAFLFNSIQILDILPDGIGVFHIWFGFNLAGYLGFAPTQNFSESNKYFNIQTGGFEPNVPIHTEYLNEEESRYLSIFLASNANELHLNIPPTNIRNALIDKMLLYFQRHHEGMKNLKSLSILKELFHA